jgi:hypothetical protein
MKDRDERLNRIDEYARGIQDDPYMPDNADAEYRLLAERSITNVMDFIIGTPAQAMYVDQFRRGHTNTKKGDTKAVQPEWDHWQNSRLDARQGPLYRGALKFGHSFTVTEVEKGKVKTKTLSALKTVALFEDPANDDEPYVALTVTRWPQTEGEVKDHAPGKARMWDAKNEYAVTFKSTNDFNKGVTVTVKKRHGADECPVTRFAAAVDLEGRTWGVVEPMIPLQNRLNQTVFDLLVVQSYASFKVRTISGMAPPIKMKPINEEGEEVLNPTEDDERVVDWVPRLNRDGKPIPDEVNLNARRVFWAEDEDTKFGTLDETPLDGFIEAIKMGFQHISALSQTPPHHLLGTIANLSADALIAAETALARKVEEFKHSFGESWERVFRLAAQIGDYEGADDFSGEVLWRDMENRSMSQVGDALGKLSSELGVPRRGLWARVPGVTANELEHWEELYEEESVDLAVASATRRASSPTRPEFRRPTRTPREEPVVA